MSGNFKKEDLRVQKTHKYLRKALEALLEKKNFKQITVNDLCEEALISRAAFYSHFRDKYDLLESWLTELAATYDTVGNSSVLEFLIYSNCRKAKNIVCGADSETLAMVHNFAVVSMERLFKQNNTDKSGGEYIVLSNFCVGGLLHFLAWQIDHCYPQELNTTINYLTKLLESIIQWDAQTRKTDGALAEPSHK